MALLLLWTHEVEFIAGVQDGGLVDEGLVAIVGEHERGAQQVGGCSWVASADAVENFEGRVGHDLLCGPRDLEPVPDHREQLLAGLGAELIGRDNATAQRAVIGHVQTGAQRRQTDEPDGEQVLTVESEIEESREVVEEVLAEVLGLVDDEDGDAS